MTEEPFRPEGMRTDAVLDSKGRPVGRLLATRYDEDGEGVAVVVLELAADVREKRLVHDERVEVGAWAVRLENGAPRLTMSLDELLDDRGVSHSDREAGRGKPPERGPHFGADTPKTRKRSG